MARSSTESRALLARSEGAGNPAIKIRVLSRHCSRSPIRVEYPAPARSSRSVHVRVEPGVSCWKQKTGHPSDRYTLVATLSVISFRRSPITAQKPLPQGRNGQSTFDTRKLLKTRTSAQRRAERPGARALPRPWSSRGLVNGKCRNTSATKLTGTTIYVKQSNQCVPANRPFFMAQLQKRCDALRDRRPL